MKRISIVIPLYNKKDYFKRCIDSIINSSVKNIDIIIVNDGSTDGSEKIAQEYKEKHQNITLFNNKNKGLSYSRNFGISKVKTDYFLLVNSDDYIDSKLLEELNKMLDKETPDLISFRLAKVDGNGKIIKEVKKPAIGKNTGPNTLFEFIISNEVYVTAPGFLYNTNFFKKNKFKYAIGRYHEDFGLTPWVIVNSKLVISLDLVGYYYVQSKNSIMRGNNYQKEKKMAYDVLYFYDDLYQKLNTVKLDESIKNIFNVHITHTLLTKIKKLNKVDKKEFVNQIRKRKVYNRLPNNTIKMKIKNILIFINPEYYFWVIR